MNESQLPDVLREVNMVRADWELPPLDDMLPGIPCVDDKCAIAASIVCSPERPRPGFMFTEQPDGRKLRAKMFGWLIVSELPDHPLTHDKPGKRFSYQDCDIPNVQLFAQAFDRGEVPDRYYLNGDKSGCKP